MDFRNVLMAIVLSTVVLIGWATFFEPPIVEEEITKNESTKNNVYKDKFAFVIDEVNETFKKIKRMGN